MADLANDKYRANLRATYIADPADASLQVDAIPPNLPTLVTVGWKTIYETVFRVTGTSGTNSSNYALTGLTVIKGAGEDTNIPEGAALNCLNHEEYFNQYSTEINALQASVTGIEAAVDPLPSGDLVGTSDTQTLTNKRITKRVASTTSSGAPAPNADTQDVFDLTAQAVTGAFVAPSGTPTDSQGLVIRIKDNGTARGLSFASGTGGYTAGGSALPTTTVTGKYLHLGFMYVTSNSLNKWMLLASAQQQ